MSDIANSAALNSATNDGNGKGANLLARCQTEDFEKSKLHKNLSQQVKPQIQTKRIGQQVTAEQKRAKHKNENQKVGGTAILNKPFRNTATTQQTKREKGSVLTRNRTNRTKQDKKNGNVSRETQTFLLKN